MTEIDTGIADVPAYDIPFDRAEYDARIHRLRLAMEAERLDGLILTEPSDIYYLSGYDTQGFWAYQAMIAPADGPLTLVCFVEEVLHAEARGAAARRLRLRRGPHPHDGGDRGAVRPRQGADRRGHLGPLPARRGLPGAGTGAVGGAGRHRAYGRGAAAGQVPGGSGLHAGKRRPSPTR